MQVPVTELSVRYEMKYNKETRETRHVTSQSSTPQRQKTLLDRFSRFLFYLGLRNNLVLGTRYLLEVGGWEAISRPCCRWLVAGKPIVLV